MLWVICGLEHSINTNELFHNFLDENPSMHSVQSGGNVSMNTNDLFQNFLNENQSMQSVQSGQSLYNIKIKK